MAPPRLVPHLSLCVLSYEMEPWEMVFSFRAESGLDLIARLVVKSKKALPQEAPPARYFPAAYRMLQ